MKAHPEVNYIRFKYKPYESDPAICGQNVTEITIVSSSPISDSNQPIDDENTIENGNLYLSSKYSDNNHLVRFDWYRQMIASLGFFKRAPEDPFSYKAGRECLLMGLYVYGRPSKREPPVLRHLDGRHTDSL
jgi:hypothetical protein